VKTRNAVWIPPSATVFSCLCESCLDVARADGSAFLAAVRAASVRGRLPPETDVGFVRCAAGHPIIVRRVESPPNLLRRDPRQLQLV
jgi:hypothetical protein